MRGITLSDGPERRVRALAFSTGGGLDFWVLTDRSMDIGPLWYGGTPVAWQHPTGFAAPDLHHAESDSGTGFQRALSGPDEKAGLFGFRVEALQNDRVRYAGQPIALVAVETIEAATEGARLLAPRYEVETPRRRQSVSGSRGARPLAPRRMRDAAGRLLGWGMGTALFHAPMFQAEARAVLRADGTAATVETSAADMGQGAWTALAQLAADGVGLDIADVDFRAGSSDLPEAGVAGGSGHTATAGAALDGAGRDVIAQLADLATEDPDSPLFGVGNAGVIGRGGGSTATTTRAAARAMQTSSRGPESPKSRAAARARAIRPRPAPMQCSRTAPSSPTARSTRSSGKCGLHASQAPSQPAGSSTRGSLESQLQGGVIWGLSFALHEEAIPDRRTGRVTNADLAGYHVPVNADAPYVEALTVHEDAPYVNALGVKGVGEIGITGNVGAIANAVWHATGVRPHRFPVRIEDLAI